MPGDGSCGTKKGSAKLGEGNMGGFGAQFMNRYTPDIVYKPWRLRSVGVVLAIQ